MRQRLSRRTATYSNAYSPLERRSRSMAVCGVLRRVQKSKRIASGWRAPVSVLQYNAHAHSYGGTSRTQGGKAREQPALDDDLCNKRDSLSSQVCFLELDEFCSNGTAAELSSSEHYRPTDTFPREIQYPRLNGYQ